LFGSRAEGRAGPDIYWDGLVVVQGDAPAERLTVLAGYDASVAPASLRMCFPTRRSRFEALKEQVDTLIGRLQPTRWRLEPAKP
jgi:predicted nucleotidyltransferase